MRSFSPCALALSLAAIALQPGLAAAHVRGHAVNVLNLPSTSVESNSFAIDLDGDGNTDNQLGSVLAVMVSSFNIDQPAATAVEVNAGRMVHLIELRSRDAAFANDASAMATWYVGEPTPAPPLFDGSDTFRYDDGFAPAQFVAPLAGGNFVSANPVTTNAPVDLTVLVRTGNYTIALPLQGTRLKFTATAAGLTQGQINGSISRTDIETIFIPALAMTFNDIVQADPMSGEAMAIKGTFDENPEDGMISVQEVATNPLMVTLLEPDVDIRDANGNYAPNPANTSPDALSFGFGFTAVVSQTLLPLIFVDGFEP